ncbi:MAG: oligosaccharide flippase family protein [Promethearchaeota archaeon]
MEPENPELTKKFFHSTVLAWFRLIFVRGTSFVYLMIIARWLTKPEMGLISLIAVGTGFISGIMTPWIAWVLQQRVLIESDKEASWNISYQLISYGFLFSFVFSPLLSFFYIISIRISIYSEPGILFILITSLLCVFQLLMGLQRAFLKLELNLLVSTAQAVLNSLMALLFYAVTKRVMSIVWAWLLSDLIIVLIILATSELSSDISRYFLVKPSRKLIIFSIPVFFLFLFRTSRNFIDRYLILLFFGEEELAVYHLVNRIAAMASEAILTLLIPFTPIMIKIGSTRPEKTQKALEGTIKMLVHFLVLVVPLLILSADLIIDIVLGEKYISHDASLILVFSSITLIFSTFNTLIIRFKGTKGSVYTMLIFAFIDLFIEIVLLFIFYLLEILDNYQIVAVAFCITLSNCCSFIIMVIRTKEIHLISLKEISRMVFLFFSQICVVVSFTYLVGPINLFEFLILVLLAFISVFFLSAFIGVLSDYELNLISRASKNRLNPIISVYRKLQLFS